MGTKEKILIRYGHEYLFWSEGYYNVIELIEDYDIYLLVSLEYEKSIDFQNFLKKYEFLNCIYSPSIELFNLKSHRNFYIFIKDFLSSSNFNYIIQNDYIEVENMYIFTIAKEVLPETKLIVRTLSRSSSKNTFTILDSWEKSKIRSKFSNNLIVEILFRVKMLIRYFLSYLPNIIFPTLVGLKKTYLKASKYQNIDNKPRNIIFDVIFTNEEFEASHLKKLLPMFKENIITVTPSPRVSFEKDNSFKNGLLFAPSLLGWSEMSSDEFKKEIIAFYKYVNALKEKNRIDHVGIKLHPASSRRNNNRLIKNELKKIDSDAVFYKANENIEKLIDSHTYIISDISSTLIKATYRPNKYVVSIDFGNSPESNIMKSYKDINYFKDSKGLESFKNINLKVSKTRDGSRMFKYIFKEFI